MHAPSLSARPETATDQSADDPKLPGAGLIAFAAGSVILGAVGFGWRDFATNWQRVGPQVPLRTALACAAAACELIFGLGLLWRRTARVAAALLFGFFCIFALLWIPPILAHPLVYDSYGNFFEESSLVIAAAVACAWLARAGSRWSRSLVPLTRLYGLCVVSYALEHFFNLHGAASFVPTWIPPGQMFWAVATAICFVLAAASILTGILSGLASRMLAIMIAGFEILGWIPRLFEFPHLHFMWAANSISIALTTAAWLISDAIVATNRARRPIRRP
jgi:hypothetical protein